MADIANIGFSADTAALSDAKAKMDGLVPSATRAERAAARLDQMLDKGAASAGKSATADGRKAKTLQDVASAADRASTATQKEAAASERAATAVQKEAAALGKLAAARNAAGKAAPMNDNKPAAATGGAQRANTSNIMAQFQDIGVTAAGGMSPMSIALQQGTQLSAVLGTMEKPLAGIAAGFAALFSTVSILTVGIIALVVAGLQMVNWISVASTVASFLAENLSALVPYITIAAAAMLLLFGPAALSAIASATAFTLGYAAAAIYAGTAAAIAWAAAAAPLTILIVGLAAVVAAVYMFRDQVKQALGIDLITVFKVMGNTMIAVSIGAVNGMIAGFAILPGALGDLMIQAANAVIGATEMMANAVISLVNQMLGSINGAMKSLPFGLGDSVNIGTVGTVKFGDLTNTFDGKAGELGKTISAEIDKASKTDWMAGIGKGIGDASDYASDKLKGLAGWLDTVDAKGAKKPKGAGGKAGGAGGKSDSDKFSDITEGAERRIAELQAERDSIGLSEEATARLKNETDLLNQARQKGIELSPEQRAQLLGLANDMSTLESETKRAKEALDFAKEGTKGFVSDLKSGLQQGKSLWESFTNAALNLANKLIDRGLNAIIDKLFEVGDATSNLGGGSGGGGFFGTLIKGIGALFSAKGNAFGASGVQAFANGGAFTNSVVRSPTMFAFAKGGALGVMGEAGPEAVMPLKRGPDGSLGVQMHDAGRSAAAGPVSNSVEVKNVYQISGAISSKEITDQIRATAEKTKEETRQSLMGWLGQYDRDGVMGSN